MLCESNAAIVAIAVYQITINDLAPRGLLRCSLARRNPLRIASQGKITAPSGRYERAPLEKPEDSAKSNGIKCPPSQSQIAARIGSEVFPVALPAVDHAKSAIKLSGNKIKATLRSAC